MRKGSKQDLRRKYKSDKRRRELERKQRAEAPPLADAPTATNAEHTAALAELLAVGFETEPRA